MLSTMRGPSVAASRALIRGCARTYVSRPLRPIVASLANNHYSAPCAPSRTFSTKKEEVHEFKAETRKLLDIVAKSLYTDQEVFIRELISNASDACEKLRFLQGSQQIQTINDADLPLGVKLSVDEAARTFTIEDSGIGMTHDQLIEHLGTIAKSGSLDFSRNEASADTNIIGQFGVGFYSTFVVADKVEVFTKTCDASKGSQGFLWSSDGSGSFKITEVSDIPRGTKIVLTLKDDAAEFSKFSTVKQAAEKFSSFIDFPLKVADGSNEIEVTKQEALWLKSSATEEEHTQFYRYLSGNSYGQPYYTLKYSTDAPLSIKSCFYLPDPDNAPSRFFSRDPEVGVSLHSRRVLVKKNADGVIPKWLHWVKGVVDCEDMPMNISRENMQDTRLMEKLSLAVTRRILRFLAQEAKRDAEKYTKFFKGYSYYLKAGLLEDREGNSGRHKDDLVKLLRFESSCGQKDELISLEHYKESAKEEQKNIYYFCCPDRKTAMASPYMEQFVKRNRNVLLMFEDLDEYVVQALESYKDMKFVAVDAADKDFELDLETVEEDASTASKKALDETQQKELHTFIKDVLKERVQEIKFSDRLVTSPAVVTSLLTPQMRKMMKTLMAGKEDTGMGSIPVTLELSAKHDIVTTLHSIRESNEVVARMVVEQLFDNAQIASGTLEDPRSLLDRLNKVVEMLVHQGAGFDYATNKYVDSSTDEASKKDGPKFEEVKSS